MQGKHEEKVITERLKQNTITLTKELEDIKTIVISIFDTIIELNESNDYGSPEVRKRRISEICRNTIKELDKSSNQI